MRVNLSLCLTATTDILNPFFMSVFSLLAFITQNVIYSTEKPLKMKGVPLEPLQKIRRGISMQLHIVTYIFKQYAHRKLSNSV